MGSIAGHIEKRTLANGSTKYKIVVDISVDPLTGKRSRIYETVDGTKKQAEKRLREIQNEIEAHAYVPKNDYTLGEWLDEWTGVHIANYSPNTLRSHKGIIDRYVRPKIGTIKLQELTTTQLQRFYNEIRDVSPASQRPISAKTVRNTHMVIQAALNKACKLGLITKNPDRDVEIPKPKRYVADVYDNNEIQKLFACAKGSDIELAVHMLLSLGVRRSELIALKWGDVDWNACKITISRTLAIKDGVLIEKAPKTESSNRTIDMPLYLLEMLRNAEQVYKERKNQMGEDFHDTDYIIGQKDGKPYKPNYFSDKFRLFIKKSGLKHIRLHDTRHSNATLMLLIGISPKVAQARLGHANFSTTMDIYSHVLEPIGKEAASKIQDCLVPCPQ